MAWPMTMTGIPRAVAISKAHDNKQNVQKMTGLLKKRVLTEKQFEDFRQKNRKIPLRPWRTKQTNHKTLKAKTEHEPCSQGGINWSKIEKSIQNKTVRTLQSYIYEVKSWPVQLLCNLGWSWHGQWRWQGYNVQAQFQSPLITNRTFKNEGPSEKLSFNEEAVWKFQTKKSKTQFLPWRKNQRATRPQGQKLKMNPCKQEEKNWSKNEKIV